MGRHFVGTILLIFAITGTLAAQARHGGGRGGHAGNGGRPPAVLVGPRVVGPPPVFVGRPAFPSVVVRRPRVVIAAPPVYSPFVYGYSAPVYTSPAYIAPSYSVNPNEGALADEVRRLSLQVEQLRLEQSQQQPAVVLQQPQPVPAPEQRSLTPTTLVFRDGRRMQIQNYAVVGQTLWVLDETSSTKIAISDLDLDATQRENRGQGVRFRIPER